MKSENMELNMKKLNLLVITLALSAAAAGCATSTNSPSPTTRKCVPNYVQGQLKSIGERLSALEQRAEATDHNLGSLSERLDRAEKTAQEALDRAAGTSAGKLLYEVVMTDDTLRFAPDSAELSEEARAALDEFAARIKAEGKPVFIEIQGHTDSRGPADYNQRLGLMRAEAVRSYLHRKGGLPLARMSVISYGESEPVADNRTREGRMQNRRVVLVVLQ